MSNFKYFKWSLVFTVLGLIAGFMIGGLEAAVLVGILVVLEVSLSFDNAVVNATVLKDMSPKWRKAFLVWGMFVAVVGMRVIFPLLIVGIVASMGPIEVIKLAYYDGAGYAKILTSAHHEIAAFGGAFLMMVFLHFFVKENQEHHWFGFIESKIAKLVKVEAIEIGLVLGTIVLSSSFLATVGLRNEFIVAGIFGLITYILAKGVGNLLEGEGGDGGNTAAKSGFAGFLYLELLDASFSFDGVIGAFALTTNLAIVAIGLGVGALFVRSFTLLLVDKGTLSEYRYLEHGAFWAIGALAAVMFVGVHIHIPEVAVGLVGAVLIVAAYFSSVRANRSDAAAEQGAAS